MFMAYIKKKVIGTKTYFYLVEGFRDNGKVKQRQLAYLGIYPTVDEAYAFHVQAGKKKRHPRWDNAKAVAAWEASCIPESKRIWHEEQAEALYPYTTMGKARHEAEEEEANRKAAKRFPGIPIKDARSINDGDDNPRLRELYPEIFARMEADRAERWRQERMRREMYARRTVEKNPYDVLGIRHNATMDEVKAVHRTLVQQWHPDVNTSPEATTRMQEINAAYTKLKARFQQWNSMAAGA
jgi:DnaJ domain